MLHTLYIENFLLLKHVRFCPAPGLNVVTGETGAGKTLLLEALHFVCGARKGRKALPLSETASVSAVFEPPDDHPVWKTIKDLHNNKDEDMLVLRRSARADGRSIGYINDRPVTLGTLRAVGRALVEIHDQFSSTELFSPAAHARWLDVYGGLQTQAVQVCASHADYKAALEKQRAYAQGLAQRQERLHDVRAAIAELEAAAIKDKEEQILLDERSDLVALQRTREALGEMARCCQNDVTMDRLHRLQRSLRSPSGGEQGASLRELEEHLERLSDAYTLFCENLLLLASRHTDDGSAIEKVEERLGLLRALSRKYACPIAGLNAHAGSLIEELEQLQAGENIAEALEEEVKNHKKALDDAAAHLRTARLEAAARLEKAMRHELGELQLDKARFRIALDRVPVSPNGTENARFMVMTNPNTPEGPLEETASGGELARFSLGLRAVTASAATMKLLAFDEIEQGLGASSASAAGKRLSQLSRHMCVITLTHAPQIAALADAHWQVVKTTNMQASESSLHRLDTKERLQDVARMLAGERITEAAKHAALALIKDQKT